MNMPRALSKIVVPAALAAFHFSAAAQSAGSNLLNLGWFHFDTHDSSEPLTFTQPASGPVAGSGATVGNADTVGLAFTHFFTDNFALTLDAGVPPRFDLKGSGTLAGLGKLGSAKQWSPALVAKWYFGAAEDKFRPFIGIGATHVWYSSVRLTPALQAQVTSGAGGATADLSSSWAPVANVGIAYNFDKNWSLGFSVSYIPLDTDADITGRVGNTVVSRSRTTLALDPVVTFLSIGYKF